jgi:general secretion pathway protein L
MQKIIAQQVNYDASTLAMSLKAKSADDLQGLTQQLNQQGFKLNLVMFKLIQLVQLGW